MRLKSAVAVPAVLAAGLSLASCSSQASYPKDRVAQKLVGVCKNEYRLDVKAQMAGTTLGAQVEIPGLLDELRKHAPSSMPDLPPVLIEGRYNEQAFDFRMFARGSFTRAEKKTPEDEKEPKEPSEPIKKLRQVSAALMRAFLSTDAPLEFYRLIARDPGPDHLDVVLSGHILDSKKVQFYAISMSELQTRNEISLRHQPEELARATVAGFIADLRKQPLPQLLSRYTAPSKRFGELLPAVLSVAADLKEEEDKLIPEEWPVIQTGKETALVDVPLARIGGVGAYLFTVQLEEISGTLLAIEKLEDGKLPSEHKRLGPPEEWSKAFYLEPISLPEFVVEQITKRVMGDFKTIHSEQDPDPALKSKLKLKKKRAVEKPATMEDVAKTLMGEAAYVTDNYDFKDFKKVAAVDALEGTHWVVSAAELPLYRRRNAPEIKPVP